MRVVMRADRTGAAVDELRRRCGRAVAKAARDIETEASVNCVDMGAVDTGFLLGSIGAEQVDDAHWRAYAAAEYAEYVDGGTARVGARPFFTRAVETVRPQLAAAFRQIPGVS